MRLKELRKKHGITQQQLAEMLQVERSIICRYETGKTIPSLPRLQQIANCIDEPLSELLGEPTITDDISIEGTELEREYLAMHRWMQEQKRIGRLMTLVSQVRGLEEAQFEQASKFLKLNIEQMRQIQSLINENPYMDDEEMAELLKAM